VGSMGASRLSPLPADGPRPLWKNSGESATHY
jgi:hypothetical protein